MHSYIDGCLVWFRPLEEELIGYTGPSDERKTGNTCHTLPMGPSPTAVTEWNRFVTLYPALQYYPFSPPSRLLFSS